MNAARHDRVSEVLRGARELSGGARAAYLEAECVDDPDLRAEVERLLARDEGPGHLDRAALTAAVTASTVGDSEQRTTNNEHRTVEGTTATDSAAKTAGAGDRDGATGGVGAVPERLGRYRIVRLIGQGGMGSVYEAEQESPRRTVALKVIRPGSMSESMLRRFEFESQVLGRLQHPGIAQIHEAGIVEEPRPTGCPATSTPFFAMEFVRGTTLTEHAAQAGLEMRQRLELMARVCDAVQHAHLKGVIHRDLKPGNILVTEEGQPKILDFGVARAIDSDVQQTMHTTIGAVIGTVQYMSPEQAAGNPDEVDTRSDVYTLGVITYELLASRRPQEFGNRAFHEALRMIREEEPGRLSSVSRALRGDVETIVAKALEKDKARRYQSAEALGADIRRYLRHEPIAARPASTWYQAATFARRHKGLVCGVAAAFVVLMAGVAATGLMLDRALRAEKRERARADELEKVASFQESQLSDIDPALMGVRLRASIIAESRTAMEAARLDREEIASRMAQLERTLAGANLTNVAMKSLEENIFDRSLRAVDEQFQDQPLLRARLSETLGGALFKVGLLERALGPQTRALEIRREILGEADPGTLTSMDKTGILRRAKGEFSEAERLWRRALEERRRVLGEEHPKTLGSLHNLGLLMHDLGRSSEAEALLREAIAKGRRVLGEDHTETLGWISGLGVVLQSLGRPSEAEALHREVLEKRRRVNGPDDRLTIGSLNFVGGVLYDQGRFAEAEPFLREALETRRRMLGDGHPDTVTSLNNMGQLLEALGDLGAAEGHYREALETCRRVRGEDHPHTLGLIGKVAYFVREQGRLSEAEPLYLEALEKTRRILGENHPSTLAAINNMTFLLRSQGRLGEIEPYSRELMEKTRVVLGEDHPDTLIALNNFGSLLQAQGRPDEAEPYVRDALERMRRVMGDHPATLSVMQNLASMLRDRGQLTEAEVLFRDALGKCRRALGDTHQRTLALVSLLSDVLLRQGKPSEAEPLCREALEVCRQALGDDHPTTLSLLRVTGRVLETAGSLSEAETYYREALAICRRVHGDAHLETLVAVNNMGFLLMRQGSAAAAEPFYREAVEGFARVSGEDAPEAANARLGLGMALSGLARYTEAEGLLLRAEPALRSGTGLPPGKHRQCVEALVGLYRAWHGVEPDRGYDIKGGNWERALVGTGR